jgi:hypothetical protein
MNFCRIHSSLRIAPHGIQPHGIMSGRLQNCFPGSTLLGMRRLNSISVGFTVFVMAMAGNLSGQEPYQQPSEQLKPIPSFGQLFPARRPVRPSHPILVNPAPLLTVATPALPSLTLRRTLASLPGMRCSVPLSNMEIPRDVNFTMRQQVPRADQLAPLPQAAPPAPTCDSPTSSPR